MYYWLVWCSLVYSVQADGTTSDSTNTFTSSFILFAVLFIGGNLIAALVYFYRRYRHNNQQASPIPYELRAIQGTEYERALQFQHHYPPPQRDALSTLELNRILSCTNTYQAYSFKHQPQTAIHVQHGFTLHFSSTDTISVDAILSTCPLLPHLEWQNTVWCYYEMTVLNAHSTSCLSVGLATRPYPGFRHIGWNLYSVGYHSLNGKLYHNGIESDALSIPFTTHDTIGCGYNPCTGDLFYTLNGMILSNSHGSTFLLSGMQCKPFHAAIAAHGRCSVALNMGQHPFQFIRHQQQQQVGVEEDVVVIDTNQYGDTSVVDGNTRIVDAPPSYDQLVQVTSQY